MRAHPGVQQDLLLPEVSAVEATEQGVGIHHLRCPQVGLQVPPKATHPGAVLWDPASTTPSVSTVFPLPSFTV